MLQSKLLNSVKNKQSSHSYNSIHILFTISNNINYTVILVSVSVTIETVIDTVTVDLCASLNLDPVPSW